MPNTELGDDDEATASGQRGGSISRAGSSSRRHVPAHPRSLRFSLSNESQGDRPPPSPPQRPVSFPSTRNAHQVDVRGDKRSAQTPQNISPGSTVDAATANVSGDLAAGAARQEARRQRRAEGQQRRAEASVIAGETETKEAQARAERQAERDRMFPPGSYEDESLNGEERHVRRVRKAMPDRTEGAKPPSRNQSDRGGSTSSTACVIM